MGLSPFGSSSYTPPSFVTGRTPNTPNPNPSNFKVLKFEVFPNGACVLVVNYPDAKNFEGNKVMVYQDQAQIDAWMKMHKHLDPHFSDKFPCPVARFIPTAEGTRLAIGFAKSLPRHK